MRENNDDDNVSRHPAVTIMVPSGLKAQCVIACCPLTMCVCDRGSLSPAIVRSFASEAGSIGGCSAGTAAAAAAAAACSFLFFFFFFLLDISGVNWILPHLILSFSCPDPVQHTTPTKPSPTPPAISGVLDPMTREMCRSRGRTATVAPGTC